MMVWLSYPSPELSLSRHSSSVPWGFTLSGGQDQALTIKVGCVLQVRFFDIMTFGLVFNYVLVLNLDVVANYYDYYF